MKKLSTVLFVLSFLISTAGMTQSGVKVSAQFGFSDVGFDRYIETNSDLSVSILVPISPSTSIGGFFTTDLSAEYNNENLQTPDELPVASINYNEYGLIFRGAVYKPGNFSIYLQSTVSIMQYKLTDNIPAAGTELSELLGEDDSESTFAIGAGVGFNLKLTNSLSWNIFEFDLTYVNFEVPDRNLHKDFKTGLTFQFQKGK